LQLALLLCTIIPSQNGAAYRSCEWLRLHVASTGKPYIPYGQHLCLGQVEKQKQLHCQKNKVKDQREEKKQEKSEGIAARRPRKTPKSHFKNLIIENARPFLKKETTPR